MQQEDAVRAAERLAQVALVLRAAATEGEAEAEAERALGHKERGHEERDGARDDRREQHRHQQLQPAEHLPSRSASHSVRLLPPQASSDAKAKRPATKDSHSTSEQEKQKQEQQAKQTDPKLIDLDQIHYDSLSAVSKGFVARSNATRSVKEVRERSVQRTETQLVPREAIARGAGGYSTTRTLSAGEGRRRT